MLPTSELLLRLALALACGAVIGLNRDLHHKPAGLRTFGLVGIGAALAVLVVIQTAGPAVESDAISRVIQGVLTGVGFLGAGVILHRVSERRVAGLTTAAAVWLIAVLGVAAGAGQYLLVGIGLGLSMFALLVGGPVERLAQRLLGHDTPQDPQDP